MVLLNGAVAMEGWHGVALGGCGVVLHHGAVSSCGRPWLGVLYHPVAGPLELHAHVNGTLCLFSYGGRM